MAKSADAFRTISEAAQELDVPQHVLRHWEEVFGQVRPMRRAGGRRYYRPLDIDLLRGVRVLLYDQRYTTKGVQKIFKEHGVKYVSELGRMDAAGEPIEILPVLNEDEAGENVRQEVMDLSESEAIAETLPPKVRKQLEALLERLEKVQEALDEATLALEAIDPLDEPSGKQTSRLIAE